MKNAKILSIIIVIGLIVSWALPEYGRVLFESKSHIEKFTVVLFIAGLYYEWKYIEEFIFGFYSISLIFVLIAGLFFSSYGINEKPGFILHSVVFVVVLIPTFQLIRLRRRNLKLADKTEKI